MTTLQHTTTCKYSIYRDFSLFALAAIGVGLAVSLTLATAIVLTSPSRDNAVEIAPPVVPAT